ncbi:aldehyde dehydrogenase family protein [bacterium]|nr:aldehyde dehydrogenase family protein [bacterium]
MLLNGLNLTDDEKLFQKTLDTLSTVLNRPANHPVTSQRVTRNCGILEGLVHKLKTNESSIAQLMVEQTHRPLAGCLTEVRRSIQTLEKARDAAHKLCEPRAYDFSDALQGGHSAMSQRFTFAPLFAITPFNFPLNLTLHKIAPAIALGLPFVCKPPLQSLELFSLLNDWLIECGLESDSFAFYFASNEGVAKAMDRLPLPLISFTGSKQVGFQLKQKYWDRKLILELGSTAMGVVCNDVPKWELERLSQDLAKSGFANSGQSCISLQHLLLESDVCDDLISHLKHTASNIARSRDPKSLETLTGPLLGRAAFDKALDLLNQALECGAQVWSAGEHNPSEHHLAPTLVIYPNCQARTLDQIRLTREEAFAPLICIHKLPGNMSVDKLAELMQRFDANIHASVFTYQNKRARQLYEVVPSRSVLWNEIPSWRADEMPYGGVQLSWHNGRLQNAGLLGDEGPYQTMLELTVERLFVLP